MERGRGTAGGEGYGKFGWRVAGGDGGEQGGIQVFQGGSGVAVGGALRTTRPTKRSRGTRDPTVLYVAGTARCVSIPSLARRT